MLNFVCWDVGGKLKKKFGPMRSDHLLVWVMKAAPFHKLISCLRFYPNGSANEK